MLRLSGLTSRTVALLALLGITGYLLARLLIPFLSPIMWASLLALFVYPFQRYLNRKISSKNLAALVGVLATIGIVVVPVILLLIQVGQELNTLYHHAQDSQSLDHITEWFKDGHFARWLEENFHITFASVRQNLSGNAEKITNAALGYVTGFISNAVALVVNLFFIAFTLFFLLRDGEQLLAWMLRLLPLSAAEKDHLSQRVQDVISATVIGNVLVAGTQGTLAGLMMWLLGVPGALLWTMVMMMLSMIPLLGTFLIWMPASIWLIASGQPVKGIVLIVWGVLIVSTVDNFMRPLLMGKQTRLHTMAIFYAVLGGLALFGPLGLLLGPIIVACFLTLVDFLMPPVAPVEAEINSPVPVDQDS